MNNSDKHRRALRIARCAAALVTALALVFTLPAAYTLRAHALSDIDFTIGVNTDVEYIAGNIIDAPILIKTQTDNGYVEMTMLLKYNQDTLSCNTILDDVEGFTTTVVDDGLNIYYKSPDNQKSPIDTYQLNIQFTVKTGVASGKYKLELDVDTNNVYGYDSNGNKEKGLLTISDATPKELTIIETGDGVTTAAEDGSEANFYTGIATTTQGVEGNATSSGGGCTAGGIIGGLIGAIVIFAAGVVVGFLLCQKRMNEEGYYMSSGFGANGGKGGGISENRRKGGFEEAPENDGAAPARPFGQADAESAAGGSIYDDVLPDDRTAGGRRPGAVPAAQQRPETPQDDGAMDTSYFGRAANQHLGDAERTLFVDEDDEFPEAFRPRRYRGGTENRFSGEFDSILGSTRRKERDDDGYGSFTISTDDETGGYGSQSQSGFGAPSQGGYGSAPQGGYGTPPQGGYGSAPQGGYGSQPQSGYGSAPQSGYGTPPQGGYGSAPYGTYGTQGSGSDDDGQDGGGYGGRGDRRFR